MIRLILLGIPTLTLVWWWWADRRLRELGHAAGLRLALAVTMLLLLLAFVWVISSRRDLIAMPIPSAWYAFLLIWSLVCLPLVAVPSMTGWSLWKLGSRIVRGPAPDARPAEGWTRRKWLAAAAVTLPMWSVLGATAVALREMRHFRVRRLTVPIAELPAELDGLRLAHVTDTHVGKFTRGDVLEEIVTAVNALQADLVLFTGDLIDNTIRDLPTAVAMLQRIDPRGGFFVVEGNHDLFDDAAHFRTTLANASGLTFLRNAAATATVRGVPLQILGLRWNDRDAEIAGDVAAVAGLRTPDAFPILLAHHPHAFDAASEQGFPLTLAGHTHGGQLMVTDEIGAGPLLFRYWSGLYRKAASALVVGNGTGNWFPLRTHAPAEILELTLRRA